MIPRPASSVFLLALAALPAQDLRHAVATADLVAVATHVGVRPIGTLHVLHRLRVGSTLAGPAHAEVSVVQVKGVAWHNQPVPAELRLYCLEDWSRQAEAAGLPPAQGPYFRMKGHPGSNPRVEGDPAEAAVVRLARLVRARVGGAKAGDVLAPLCDLAMRGTKEARTEAVRVLDEDSALREALNRFQLSDLLLRAVGETDDLAYKIALAELCGARRVEGLIDGLCLSMAQMPDPLLARAIGRIARHLHGEQATDQLAPHVLKARNAELRGLFVLALGATETQSALEALLRMHRERPDDPRVAEALRWHGAPQALEAVASRPATRPR